MRRLLLLMVVLLLLVAPSCADGDGEIERALRSADEADLTAMVLQKEDLGPGFEDLVLSEESGILDNEHVAYGTMEPDDTAVDIEQAGRITGYAQGYEAPDFDLLWEAGEGVYSVGTRIDLFADSDQASAFIRSQLDDLERFEGQQYAVGLTLEEFETFPVADLGDEAIGVRTRGNLFAYATVNETAVAFRIGPLVAAASLARPDDRDVNSRVEEIARALERRIEGVLGGAAVGSPVASAED